MNDKLGRELEESREMQLQQLRGELKEGRLSRRDFMNFLTGLGVSFGAAYALGVRDAGAHANLGRELSFTSTDPALNDILSAGKPGSRVEVDVNDPKIQKVQMRPHGPAFDRYDRSLFDRTTIPYSRCSVSYDRCDY